MNLKNKIFENFKNEITEQHKIVLRLLQKDNHIRIEKIGKHNNEIRESALKSDKEKRHTIISIILKEINESNELSEIADNFDILEYIIRDLYIKNLITIKSVNEIDIIELEKGYINKLTTLFGDEFIEYFSKKSRLRFE